MFWEMISRGGTMMYPILALSVVIWALIVERLVFWRRMGSARGEQFRALLADVRGHRSRIRPLAGLAVTLGLLGSVSGMIQAFNGFKGGLDPDRVTEGLAVAFLTTQLGMVVSVAAALACYVFDLWARRYAPQTSPAIGE